MNQQIIGFSARKCGGKNTATNFMVGLHLLALSIVKGNFTITPEGQLYVTDIYGDTSFEGIFDINRGTPTMEQFLEENLNQFVKVYSFADLLKTEVCMKILGLTYEQCYGTDEQKNSLTVLNWENMPGVCSNLNDWNDNLQRFNMIYHEPGLMTAREVMQYVGSNIFRKMYGNVWVDATIRRIKDEGANTAIITDCRFPNEVEGIQKNNGKVIRLTRNPHPDDSHISETALDNYVGFDVVLDNSSSTIAEQNKLLYEYLKKMELLPIELEI